jgi:phosphopantetheinyl transferase (holo-ACP synthase)
MLDLATFSEHEAIIVKREQEKRGTQFLLQRLLGTPDFKLRYTPENKPFLLNTNQKISISHSHDKLVILINDQEETGVDIELVRDKVVSVKHKFLNNSESAATGDDVRRLITFWAAKEALYKVYGRRKVDFKAHLFVEEVSPGFLTGAIVLGSMVKRYNLVSELLDNYIMVYVLNEI